jgi:hypothetical protein
MSRKWAAAVSAICDPVFAAADAGFIPADGGFADALLWEADPSRFAQRYPDSGIKDSFSSAGWPPDCIDYWLYVDANKRQARLAVEGWAELEIELELTGDGDRDGLTIAREFARILRVEAPTG